jgi:hypothetical protein
MDVDVWTEFVSRCNVGKRGCYVALVIRKDRL